MPKVSAQSTTSSFFSHSLQQHEENIAANKKGQAATTQNVTGFVKRASQLRGLVFGNRLDELLGGGLLPKSMTFVYGDSAERLMNILCGNAVRIFGGCVIFIDAANSFDPYLIVRQQSLKEKSASASKKLLRSIIISRAFTCYQLHDLVTKQIEKLLLPHPEEEKKINSIFVSGIGSVFNEQDNTEEETERLQLLMASALRNIASEKKNSVQFVVASSKTRSEHFISKSDTAIKLFEEENARDGRTRRRKRSNNAVHRAILMKHYVRQFAVVDL